jgi:hypothetical protein
VAAAPADGLTRVGLRAELTSCPKGEHTGLAKPNLV